LGYCSPATAVDFGTTPAASFVINSDTSITAVSPAHAAGTVDVTVTNAQGTSATTPLDQFTFSLFTLYFQWFDKASAGFLNDNIHLLSPFNTPSTVAVSVAGGTPVVQVVQPQSENYVTFPQGTIGGPVKVQVTAGANILASQRVQFRSTFNEVWAHSSA